MTCFFNKFGLNKFKENSIPDKGNNQAGLDSGFAYYIHSLFPVLESNLLFFA